MKVKVLVEFAGESGEVLLYTFPEDPNPVSVSAPGGLVKIEPRDPQTVYYEVLDGTEGVRVTSDGYVWPEGFNQ